jgi:hypothetical protein
MKTIETAAFILLAGTLASPAFGQRSRDAAIAKAEIILRNLQDGQPADVVKELDPKLTEALPEQKLKAVWPGVTAQFGAFKNINERREGRLQGRPSS